MGAIQAMIAAAPRRPLLVARRWRRG